MALIPIQRDLSFGPARTGFFLEVWLGAWLEVWLEVWLEAAARRRPGEELQERISAKCSFFNTAFNVPNR